MLWMFELLDANRDAGIVSVVRPAIWMRKLWLRGSDRQLRGAVFVGRLAAADRCRTGHDRHSTEWRTDD